MFAGASYLAVWRDGGEVGGNRGFVGRRLHRA